MVLACSRLLLAVLVVPCLAGPEHKHNQNVLFEILQTLGAGHGSVERALTLAASVQGSGSLAASIQELAGINLHNAERDLHRWVSRQAWRQLLPATYVFDVMVSTSEAAVAVRPHAALLPHEVVGQLWSCAPELFEHLLTGGEDNLLQFWRAAEAHKDHWYEQHPVIKRVADARLRIPIGMHGDDAGVHGTQQVLVITWNSVAVKRPTLDNRIVFTMIRVAELVKDGAATLQEMMDVFRWSLHALSDGMYPVADHKGRPFDQQHHPARYKLAGRPLTSAGHCGAWSEFRGDWKFLKECLFLKQSYANNYICHLCKAHKRIRRLLYTQFGRTAHHRRTLIDPDEWLRVALLATLVSPVLLVPGFCILHVYFDIMHCLDLGVSQYTVPSAMFELARCNAWPGGTLQQQFQAAYVEYRRWAKTHNVRAIVRQPFDVKAWRKGTSFPHITQRVAKAAALRSLVYWVAEVCTRFVDDKHGKVRALLFKSHVRVDVLLRRAGRVLDPAEREQLASAVEAALLCNNWLAQATLQARLWKLVPKHHAVQHLGDAVTNPRSTQCYADEDLVGRCKRIYNRCHGSSAALRGLQRYSILLCVRWWEQLRELRHIP
jgi:hypothetical protein